MSLEWIRGFRNRSAERRRRRDRRARHVLFADWRWSYEGRRRSGRRTGEYAEAGVDLYEPTLFRLALGIFLLSCADALLTLTLIGRGVAYEANPFMGALLSYDPQTFVNLKIVFTGGGLLFLTAMADSKLLRFVRVRTIMNMLLFTYALVVSYQLMQLIITG
jgi:hypothetical protein